MVLALAPEACPLVGGDADRCPEPLRILMEKMKDGNCQKKFRVLTEVRDLDNSSGKAYWPAAYVASYRTTTKAEQLLERVLEVFSVIGMLLNLINLFSDPIVMHYIGFLHLLKQKNQQMKLDDFFTSFVIKLIDKRGAAKRVHAKMKDVVSYIDHMSFNFSWESFTVPIPYLKPLKVDLNLAELDLSLIQGCPPVLKRTFQKIRSWVRMPFYYLEQVFSVFRDNLIAFLAFDTWLVSPQSFVKNALKEKNGLDRYLPKSQLHEIWKTLSKVKKGMTKEEVLKMVIQHMATIKEIEGCAKRLENNVSESHTNTKGLPRALQDALSRIESLLNLDPSVFKGCIHGIPDTVKATSCITRVMHLNSKLKHIKKAFGEIQKEFTAFLQIAFYILLIVPVVVVYLLLYLFVVPGTSFRFAPKLAPPFLLISFFQYTFFQLVHSVSFVYYHPHAIESGHCDAALGEFKCGTSTSKPWLTRLRSISCLYMQVSNWIIQQSSTCVVWAVPGFFLATLLCMAAKSAGLSREPFLVELGCGLGVSVLTFMVLWVEDLLAAVWAFVSAFVMGALVTCTVFIRDRQQLKQGLAAILLLLLLSIISGALLASAFSVKGIEWGLCKLVVCGLCMLVALLLVQPEVDLVWDELSREIVDSSCEYIKAISKSKVSFATQLIRNLKEVRYEIPKVAEIESEFGNDDIRFPLKNTPRQSSYEQDPHSDVDPEDSSQEPSFYHLGESVAVKFAEEHLDQTFLKNHLKQPSVGSDKRVQDSMRVKNITLKFDTDEFPPGRTFVEVHRVAGKKVLRVVVTIKNPDPNIFTCRLLLMELFWSPILLILTLVLATTMVTIMEFLAQQCKIVALQAYEDAWNTIAPTIQYMVCHKYLFITAWLAFCGFVVCLLNKKSPNRGPPIERPKDYPVFRVAVALFILCDVAAYVQSVVSPWFCSQHLHLFNSLELVSSTVFLAEFCFVCWLVHSSYDRSKPTQVRISLMIGLVLDQMAIWPAYIQVFFPSTHAELPTLSRGKPHDL